MKCGALRETGAIRRRPGGGGRLWVLRADGPPVLMLTSIATYMRMGADDPCVVGSLSKQISLAPDETEKRSDHPAMGNFGSNFKSGQVLSSIPGRAGGGRARELGQFRALLGSRHHQRRR
jgi:hypothetical protein